MIDASPTTPSRARRPLSFVDLLRSWPDTRSLCDDLSISYFTVAAWLKRDSVPEEHWDDLAAAAAARGLKHVTYARFRAYARHKRVLARDRATPCVAVQDVNTESPIEATSRKGSHAT